MGKQLIITNGASPFEARNQAVDATFISSSFGVGNVCITSPTLPSGTEGAKTVDFATDITSGSMPFQIIWKKGSYATTGSVVSTPVLTLNELVSYKKIDDDAGTAQITTLTLSLPTTQLVGDTYRLTIVDTTPGTAALTKYHYEVQHTGTDFTATTLGDAFRTLINAETSTNLVAATGTTTLILTGQTKYNHFRVSYDGEASASIVYTQDLVIPTGTYAQIYAMETEFKSHGEGITNRVLYPVKDYTYEANSSNTYDLGVFKFNLRKPAKHGMASTNFEEYTLYIAEKADTDGSGIIDLIITAATNLFDATADAGA